MAWFWWLLGVIVVILWIVAVVDIIRRRHERPGVKTVAWILLVIIIPVIGTLTYFLVNGVPGRSRDVVEDQPAGRGSGA
jgi:type VI protein secretion system component VasK